MIRTAIPALSLASTWGFRDAECSFRAEAKRLGVVVLSSSDWPALRPIAVRFAIPADVVQAGQVVEVGVATL